MEANNIIAIGALITSICSIIMTINESRKNRKHQKLSVTPVLDIDVHAYKESGKFQYEVTNRGLGPAYISKFLILVDGIMIEGNISNYWERAIDKLGITGWTAKFFTPTSRSILPPGDSRMLLDLQVSKEDKNLHDLAKRIDIHIAYTCSYSGSYFCGMSRDFMKEKV